jgi:hypothetical protein
MTAGFEPDLLYVVRGETSCPDSAIVFKKGLGTLRPSYYCDNVSKVHLRTYLRHEQEQNLSSTELFCCAHLVLQLSYRTNANAKATCQSAIQGAPCHPMPRAQLIGVCSMLENNKRRPIPPKRPPMLETSHQLNEKRGSSHRRVRHKHETAHQSEEKRSY